MLRKQHFYIFSEVLFIYMQMQIALTTEIQKVWDQNHLKNKIHLAKDPQT